MLRAPLPVCPQLRGRLVTWGHVAGQVLPSPYRAHSWDIRGRRKGAASDLWRRRPGSWGQWLACAAVASAVAAGTAGVRDRGRPQRVSAAPPGPCGGLRQTQTEPAATQGPQRLSHGHRPTSLPPHRLSSLPHASISACLSHTSLGQMSCLKRSRRFLCT